MVSANIYLQSVGTGYVNITNTGLRLPNGNSTLNWYQESNLAEFWANTTTPSGTGTSIFATRIGRIVFITINSSIFATRIGRIVFITINSSAITPNSLSSQPYFNLALPSAFWPASTVKVSHYNGNINPYIIEISIAGTFILTSYSLNASITPTLNVSYYTNSVTGSSGIATGQGGGASRSSGNASSNPPDVSPPPSSFVPNNNTTPVTPPPP